MAGSARRGALTHGLPLLLVATVIGTSGWFFFYAIFALRIRRNDTFNATHSPCFISCSVCELDVLSARTAAEVVSRVALANPITWQIDWLRFTSIGTGALRSVLIESGAFLVFAAICFAYAVRCLQRQE